MVRIKVRTTRKALFLRGALLPLLVFLAACKPQNAANPAPRGPAPSELIRLAVWPDEDTRWQVCESTWEEFAKGGYVKEDVTAAAFRYSLPVPLEGVRGELRLFWPLASVVQECGDLALRGLRPYRPSNRPPVMVHQPFLAYWGPEKPPEDWQAQLVLLDGHGDRVGYLPSSPFRGGDCLLGSCSGEITFWVAYPSQDFTQVQPSLEGGFFLDALDKQDVKGMRLEVYWGDLGTDMELDLGGLHGAPQAGSR